MIYININSVKLTFLKIVDVSKGFRKITKGADNPWEEIEPVDDDDCDVDGQKDDPDTFLEGKSIIILTLNPNQWTVKIIK